MAWVRLRQVITLWYRPPEILLESDKYGAPGDSPNAAQPASRFPPPASCLLLPRLPSVCMPARAFLFTQSRLAALPAVKPALAIFPKYCSQVAPLLALPVTHAYTICLFRRCRDLLSDADAERCSRHLVGRVYLRRALSQAGRRVPPCPPSCVSVSLMHRRHMSHGHRQILQLGCEAASQSARQIDMC